MLIFSAYVSPVLYSALFDTPGAQGQVPADPEDTRMVKEVVQVWFEKQ